MTTRTVDISEAGAVLRAGHVENVEALERAQYRAALRAVPIVAAATPVDRGATRAAWRVVLGLDGAELRNDSAIAGILELGSRPHRPPLMPILRWLVRQEGLDLSGGKRSFESLYEVPDETIARAMGVVRAIERRGTRPHYMVRDNLPRLVALLRAEVERALEATS